jgi:hypothetical protein
MADNEEVVYTVEIPRWTEVDELKILRLQIAERFHREALGYFRVGMREFHGQREIGFHARQAAIGNLVISIELFMKGEISRQHVALLYKDLPPELMAALLTGGVSRALWFPHLVRLRSGEFETIDFLTSIARYLMFKPQLENARSSLRDLAWARNASVHSTLPGQDVSWVLKAAYLAMQVCRDNTFQFDFSEEDLAFEQEFNASRVERVEKALKQSRANLKKKTSGVDAAAAGWGEMVSLCPVCGCLAVCKGESVLTAIEGDHRAGGVALSFHAQSFECSNCGLSLGEATEMDIAGVETTIPREHSEVASYLAELNAGGIEMEGPAAAHWYRLRLEDGRRITYVGVQPGGDTSERSAASRRAYAAAQRGQYFDLGTPNGGGSAGDREDHEK